MDKALCEIPVNSSVLVTGATGFTGIVLTRKLVEAGLKVSAVARKSSNLEPLKDLDITWFRGDERVQWLEGDDTMTSDVVLDMLLLKTSL